MITKRLRSDQTIQVQKSIKNSGIRKAEENGKCRKVKKKKDEIKGLKRSTYAHISHKIEKKGKKTKLKIKLQSLVLNVFFKMYSDSGEAAAITGRDETESDMVASCTT